MTNVSYADGYRGIDFRKHPQKYAIGKGEQGVLIAEPYKSEILPFWKFSTPNNARESAKKIFDMFHEYKDRDDFVGMDMARKFLQMGFTRSRRYANHASGRKYNPDKTIRKRDEGSDNSLKAESARIFYRYYIRARGDSRYKILRAVHLASQRLR